MTDALPARPEIAEHTVIDRLYAEWLACRSRVLAEDGLSPEDEVAADDRTEELVGLIAAAPVRLPWLIMRKLEVLERVLEGREMEPELPRPEFGLIAGIRADLARLQVSA